MSDRSSVAVRLFFTGLPIAELGVYRQLRQLGIDRYVANIVMFGRWTVHRQGELRVTPA